jgi:hypothetical protein
LGGSQLFLYFFFNCLCCFVGLLVLWGPVIRCIFSLSLGLGWVNNFERCRYYLLLPT